MGGVIVLRDLKPIIENANKEFRFNHKLINFIRLRLLHDNLADAGLRLELLAQIVGCVDDDLVVEFFVPGAADIQLEIIVGLPSPAFDDLVGELLAKEFGELGAGHYVDDGAVS